MWQLFALASLFASALQNVADKWAIVSDRRIDTSVATFWRGGLFFLFVLVLGATGYFGSIDWYFDQWIVLFAFSAYASSIFYTYLLRRLEVTSVQMDTYLLPILLLAIDIFLIQAGLSAWQIAGVLLLTIGGLLFAIDGKTHHLKREFSLQTWAIIFYWVVYGAAQYYLFQYLHDQQGVNSVSFAASIHVITISLALLVVCVRGQFFALFRAASAKYIVPVALGKACDATAEVLMLTALMYASASQVGAIGALLPVILFVLAELVQKFTRFNIRERDDRANIVWKIGAVALVSLGIFLVG